MFELRYVNVTPPTAEPLTLADVRAHLRIDDDDTSQDSTLGILIPAARRYAETYTGRSLMSQTWMAVADGFPGCYRLLGAPFSAYAPVNVLRHQQDEMVIKLMRGPVTAVNSIAYIDTNGALQTLDPSTYIFDSSDLVQRIAPAFGSTWPAARMQMASVKITFAAGYANASAIPGTFMNWMLVRIATAFEHREAEEIVAKGKLQPLEYVDTLLDSEKVWAL